MQIHKLNENKLIDLKKLSEILLMKKLEGVKKWCQDKGIKIEMVGNKRVVHRFMIDLELDKGLIFQLQEKYPKKWEELYKCYKENDHLGYISLIKDDLEFNVEAISNRIMPVSDRAKKLLNS